MRKILKILGVAVLLVALLLPAAVVLAQDVTVSIDAPALVDPGSDFFAWVDIVDVENLDSAQYDIVFDDTVLRLDDVTAGTVDGTAIPVDIWNEVAPGRVIVVQNVPGLTGVTGDGWLAVLEFHVIGDAGDESDIDFQNALLGDNTGVAIPAIWVDGAVTVSGAPPPGDVVVSIDAPDLVAPGDDFIAWVDIVNVENLDAAQYDVVFDDTVLRLDDVTDGTVDGTVIPVDIWNDVDGRVIIVQNVPGLVGADGDGWLAVLEFHVIGEAGDESDIDLQNGILGDNEGVAIPATWVDGAVTVSGDPPPGAVVVSIDAPAEVNVGSAFFVWVDIVNVDNLDATEYDVVFDDTVLQLDDVTDGTVDGTVIPVDIWNEVDGRVTIVQNVPGLTGADGDGWLAVLWFNVIGDVGDVSAIDLQNGILGDTEGVEINAFWIDGVVDVITAEFHEIFVGTLSKGVTSYICTIPGGATVLEVFMTTAASPGPDMDLELYDGATEVIGEHGVIHSPPGGWYGGDYFFYSGWEPSPDPGSEYITSLGPLGRSYDLYVYAYQAGTYTVDVFYVMPGPDHDPPVIDIYAPDATVGVPATITVSATDPSGFAWIWYGVWPDWYVLTGTEADYISCIIFAEAPGNEVSLDFIPTAGIIGDYYVAAWACDMVGNCTPDLDPETADWEVT